MSNVEHSSDTSNAQPCEFHSGCDAVTLIIEPKSKSLGEFSVRRSLPNVRQKMIGPWVFFDHAGPAQFPAGKGTNVRPHPHINLATVSYLFDGEILHRDSLGSEQLIRPGDINLMVAGSGIVHSERERDAVRNKPHSLHALQLWLALPEEHEETDPEFLHYPAHEIPTVNVNGIAVRVMMGKAFGAESPVKTFAETLYLEASLQAGEALTVPSTEERGVYVVSGSLQIGATALGEHTLAVLETGHDVKIIATTGSRIAIIGGEKLSKRYMDWNFISSRKDRVEQAKNDWKHGKFPTVPGDETEFIPLPE